MSVLCLWLFTKKSTKVQAGDLLGSKSEVHCTLNTTKFVKTLHVDVVSYFAYILVYIY